MSTDVEGHPTRSVLTGATVFIMNKGIDAKSGQGMLAVSADGCFYLEGGDPFARAISLSDLEAYLSTFQSPTEDQRKILDLVLSTIATFKAGGRPQ